jgi:hypothetical protein
MPSKMANGLRVTSPLYRTVFVWNGYVGQLGYLKIKDHCFGSPADLVG